MTPEREAEIRLYVERLKEGASFGFSGAAIEELLARVEELEKFKEWALAQQSLDDEVIESQNREIERLKAL
jgi:hypothetical protein